MTDIYGPYMSKCRLNTVAFGFGQCCAPTPYIDTNQSLCVDACPPRTYIQANTVNCLPCASDCFSCTNSSTCTACNSSIDNRQLNTTTGRCNLIVSGGNCVYPSCCGSTPIIYSAQSTCVASCPARTFLNNNTMTCLPCVYDCYTCNNNTTCLTCDNTTDHR